MSANSTKGDADVNEAAVRRSDQIRLLKWYYLLAGANTAFAQCTFGGGMFPLYLKELGLSAQRIGALMGLIPFMQVLALFATPLIERLGYRRSYLLFYGSRKFTIMALILAPWVLSIFGNGALFYFVAGCILLFGVQRALGETAYYPWLKEVVPDSIRGRAQGMANLCGALASGVGFGLAGFFVDYSGDLGLGRFGGFQAGYFFFACVGLVGIASAMRMVGGQPVERHPDHPPFLNRLREAARDRRFLMFLVGAGVLQGSATVFGTFMALYARELLGIPSGTVVQMSIATMAGGVTTGYLWGRAADQYGSRRILTILFSLLACMPLAWMGLPLFSAAAMLPVTAVAYFLFGGVFFGAMAASFRLMYNSIIREEKKGEYLAIRYAVVGIIAGSMPTLAGQSVGLFEGVGGSYLGVPLTPFTPLFAILAAVWAGTAWLFGRIGERGDASDPSPRS